MQGFYFQCQFTEVQGIVSWPIENLNHRTFMDRVFCISFGLSLICSSPKYSNVTWQNKRLSKTQRNKGLVI